MATGPDLAVVTHDPDQIHAIARRARCWSRTCSTTPWCWSVPRSRRPAGLFGSCAGIGIGVFPLPHIEAVAQPAAGQAA